MWSSCIVDNCCFDCGEDCAAPPETAVRAPSAEARSTITLDLDAKSVATGAQWRADVEQTIADALSISPERVRVTDVD